MVEVSHDVYASSFMMEVSHDVRLSDPNVKFYSRTCTCTCKILYICVRVCIRLHDMAVLLVSASRWLILHDVVR